MISPNYLQIDSTKIKYPTKKPNNLQINTDDNIQTHTQSINTVKKAHLWKKIYTTSANIKTFEQSQCDKNQENSQTYQKIQLLENEKQNLLKELEQLKSGAINALMEKEEQIQELKKKMENNIKDQKLGQLQEEMRLMVNQLESAKIEIQQLKKELESIRSTYHNQIESKNQMICQLGQQLQKCKLKFQDIKYQDQILTQKLHVIEKQNQQLHQQLINSKINMVGLKQCFNNSVAMVENQVKSQKSEVTIKKLEPKNFKTQESNLSDKKISMECFGQEEDDRISKLEQLNRKQRQKHQRQLKKLEESYQNQLLMVKAQYQNQLQKYINQNNQQQQNILLEQENQSDMSSNNSNNLKKQINESCLKNQQKIQEQGINQDNDLNLVNSRKQQNCQYESDFSNNFHYQRNLLQNIKENHSMEKSFRINRSKLQKQQSLQKVGKWLTKFLQHKKQYGMIIMSAMVSHLIYNALKIKK